MDQTKSLNSPPDFIQQYEAEYWIRVVEDLKLSDVEIKKIIDELAKVLKLKKNQEKYLTHVEAQINKFTQKVAKHQAHKEILTIHQQLHEEAHEG
jgi:ABC-type hemin transport system substrate-binding protein